MLVGVWLLASSLAWRHTHAQAVNGVVCGFLAIAFALTAQLSGLATRLLNVLVGLWLMLAAALFSHATAGSAWNQVAAGYALIMFGFIPRGGPGTRPAKPTAPVNF